MAARAPRPHLTILLSADPPTKTAKDIHSAPEMELTSLLNLQIPNLSTHLRSALKIFLFLQTWLAASLDVEVPRFLKSAPRAVARFRLQRDLMTKVERGCLQLSEAPQGMKGHCICCINNWRWKSTNSHNVISR